MDSLSTLQDEVAAAERSYASGDFQSALRRYRKAVRSRLTTIARDDGDWWAADAVIIERLADLAALEGSVVAAQQLLDGLHGIYLRNGNAYAADYVALKLSHLAIEDDDVAGAHEGLARLKSTIGDIETIDLSPQGLRQWQDRVHWRGRDESSRDALLVRIYLVMGALLGSYGQFADSIRCLEQGTAIARASELPSVRQLLPSLLTALASSRLATGEFAAVDTCLAQSEEDGVGASPATAVRRHEIRARCAMLQGQYGAALKSYRRVLAECEEIGFARPIVNASMSCANIFILLNHTRNALEQIEAAEQYAAEDSAALARLRVLRSLAHARRESLAEEIAIAPSVTEMWRGDATTDAAGVGGVVRADPLDLPASSDFLSFFEDRALAVQWRLGRKQFVEAGQLLDSLLPVFSGCDSPVVLARIKLLRGMVDYYRQRDTDAEASLRAAAAELQALGLAPELMQAKRVLAWCGARLGWPQQQVASLDSDVQQIIDSLALSLDRHDRPVFLINKWTASEEFLLGEIERVTSMSRQANAAPWWRRFAVRVAVLRRLNDLLARMEGFKSTSARVFLGMDPENDAAARRAPALWQRLLLHPPRTASIHFLVLPDRVVIVQQSWLRIGFGVSAISRADLRDLVAEWYRSGSGANESGASPLSEGLANSGQNAIDRLADALQLNALLDALPRRVRHLRIAPDDSLLGFPFAILQFRNRALPDAFAVTIAIPGVGHDRPRRQRLRRALFVGVSKGTERIRVLPCVESELADAASWAENNGYEVETLLDYKAGKDAVLDGMAQAGLVHIATHGVFAMDRPGNSGFILLPAPDRVEVLSLSDIGRIDLSRLDHATLSSCWAADRFTLPGRQTIGLPETFIHSGTGSVLACLWPVNDLVAARFSSRFYEHLDRCTRGEALRRTQLDCIHGRLLESAETPIDTSQPRHWAGFQLYGAQGSLR